MSWKFGWKKRASLELIATSEILGIEVMVDLCLRVLDRLRMPAENSPYE